MSHQTILIIGAGMSGLAAASQLRADGYPVALIDKGRGIGGRVATRRLGEVRLDHGAQFFTARDPWFKAKAADWQAAEAVTLWYDHALRNGTMTPVDPHYRGRDGMSRIAKCLAKGLTVKTSHRAISVSRRQRQWQVELENQTVETADTLIMTAPVPQCLALLDAGNVSLPEDTRHLLQGVKYARSLVLLALLKGPSGLSAPGFIDRPTESIQWITDNQLKGIAKHPALTVHSTPAFAERYFDADPAVWQGLLMQELKPLIQSEPGEVLTHRWGFAYPLETAPGPCLWLPDMQLGLAGDGFTEGRVESAALSGYHLARLIHETLRIKP